MSNHDHFSVEHILHETRKFHPSSRFKNSASIDLDTYEKMYQRSLHDSEAFWLEQANTLDWIKKPLQASSYLWDSETPKIEHSWFKDGTLNVSVNCLDRHLKKRGSKPAIIWEGDSPQECRVISYQELHASVCRFANVLKAKGVKKGDRVCIYLPMIPELAIAMLACARIGAIHSIVFGGFSAESLARRINDSKCCLLVTANAATRNGKILAFKTFVDEALEETASIQHVIVIKRNLQPCAMQQGRDTWYDEEIQKVSSHCPAEELEANDPLFILYTSGSTGQPKGVVHGQAGYLLQASLSHRYIFDLKEDDIYWCTADIGWITGHSYAVYGPLANGATTLLFEGTPTHPDAGRFWEIIDRYRVTLFYTAPTVIRMLIRMGVEYPNKYKLDSLRLLGTVGEPINPEAWIWYYENIGKKECPVVDTWWQTETGGIMISPIPGCHTLKPGCVSRPFFGVDPVVVKEDNRECAPDEGGSLCIRRPWPGIMLTTWGDHKRFIETYFTQFKGMYFTGDGALKDQEGDFWLLGRIDDVVNISGHRFGTAEIESALVSHPKVAEAAVVPVPHEIKGQTVYAYVTLKSNVAPSESLKNDLKEHVKSLIGSIAIPEKILFAQALPKTRSGKIMRRVLRKIAENKLDELGDISTLADPQVLESLLENNA